MFEITQIGQHLLIAGIALFVGGLIQGALIPLVKNARMGLAGHLTAVQCGMALSIFGLMWSLVGLSPFWQGLAAYGAVAGFLLIWTGITTASVTGASQALPIAGAGFSGSQRSEAFVKLVEAAGVVLSLGSAIIILIGLISTLGD